MDLSRLRQSGTAVTPRAACGVPPRRVSTGRPWPAALRLAGAFLAMSAAAARAQDVADGTDARIGPDATRILLDRIGRTLHGGTEAKVTALREGRQGALCGAVEVRNRMGTYTGARPFVFERETGFLGRLPEGPELRNPASAADYEAMERARTLFLANCTEK
ncbi:hypothetical protein [Methylobacterium aerolatum]|uniref:Uncharacterized protein n=1 Tax=Methylobacterium aerolatum TaxID=418708 RepID=A0ABU0I419_9HYPH|nr:hypothetical protein [Methylobacterium aerolatum]MDQ0448645.1 hypothetical protein [Methylobacterium aerolatum]GJD37293.1 hypothetical protein FMGBMHLM_4221 [Methylobacterium aerolatum]